MKTILLALSLAALSVVKADVPAYGQCGGLNYTGETTCVAGYTCVYSNDWYSQCVPGTNTVASSSRSSSRTSSRSTSTTRVSSSTRTTSTSRTSTSPVTTSSPAGGVTGWAALGGTTGGQGGSTTRVSTLAALKTAVSGDSPKIVILTASLSGNEAVAIGSNTSLYGASGSITLTGIGLKIAKVNNVIIRNLTIKKVLADAGDHIGVQYASKVFIDHVDLSSDRDHDKDYYDGLCDLTHGVTYATVSNSYFHDHWKTVLIGHSDSNESEDTAMTITLNNNYFKNLNSRGPSFRFGKGHVYNNYYVDMSDGINTRVGAVLRVENNVWTGTCSKALYSTDGGYAQASGNDFGTCESGNTALAGSLSIPYSYSLLPTSSVPSSVVANAGAKLSF